MSKDTATFIAPLLVTLIIGIVPIARCEIKAHTDAILAELDWYWDPKGRHMREFNRALAIYHDGIRAFILFGAVTLFLGYAAMDAIALVFETHPSGMLMAVMCSVGLALWGYTAPSLLRSAHDMACAASPMTLRPTLARLTSGKVLVGMINSMTRQKIAITLPEEQVAAARQAVAEGRAASVSAFISQALARRDADEEMSETIAEIYAENGQPTEEDRLWARRVLGLEP